MKVAEHCCRTFARDVLRYVEAEEGALEEVVVSNCYAFPNRKYRNGKDKDGFEILRERAGEWTSEQEPIFALVREWCGRNVACELDQVLVLQEEKERLLDLARIRRGGIAPPGFLRRPLSCSRSSRRTPCFKDAGSIRRPVPPRSDHPKTPNGKSRTTPG